MATSTHQAKPDAKPEAKTETQPEAKEEQENTEPPLKYKTWVLKVSIHCEGCKRKVKKILTNIDGVYTTDIDLRQQKVKVTGNIEADTLIRKLTRAGRHAELWPEKAQKEKKQGKSKKKEKQSDQEGSKESNHGGDKEKETVKIEAPVHQESSKTSENGSSGKNVDGTHVLKAHEGGSSSTGKSVVQIKEPKPEFKQTVTFSAGTPPAPVEVEVSGENEAGGENSGGAHGGKKKKKKGQKGNGGNNNSDEGAPCVDTPASTGSSAHDRHTPAPSPANYSLPRHHGYEYPTYYYAPPAYAVCYNAAQPSNRYAASYYSAPPPYSYAYMHPGPVSATGSESEYYSSRPSDSFELFSDENPNACSMM